MMTDYASDQKPFDCARLRRSPLLHAYLDGELPVAEALNVQFHLERCVDCGQAAERERAFRRRLRQEMPRIIPSGDLHDRVRRAIRRVDRKERLRRSLAQVGLGVLASVVLVAVLAWGLRAGPLEPDLVRELVSSHRLYRSLDAPAELASSSRVEVAGWVRRPLALSVPVPDFSRAGLRLIGARLDAHGEHPAVHLFYEKGRALLSLYLLPASGVSLPRQGRTPLLDGREMLIRESAEYRVLLGRSGRFVFALVSTLDREVLIECARTFLQGGGQVGAGAAAGLPGISTRWWVFSLVSGSITT